MHLSLPVYVYFYSDGDLSHILRTNIMHNSLPVYRYFHSDGDLSYFQSKHYAQQFTSLQIFPFRWRSVSYFQNKHYAQLYRYFHSDGDLSHIFRTNIMHNFTDISIQMEICLIFSEQTLCTTVRPTTDISIHMDICLVFSEQKNAQTTPNNRYFHSDGQNFVPYPINGQTYPGVGRRGGEQSGYTSPRWDLHVPEPRQPAGWH